MYRSGEIRWFFRGELPRNVQHWFEVGGPGRREPQRTDEYLRLPDCETASAKLRNGKFEIKARTSAPARVEYVHDICGLRDSWVKWSSSAGDIERFRAQFVRAEDDWVYVTKERQLRLISLENSTPIEITPGGAWLPRGCQVELTDIEVRFGGEQRSPAATWWSLSFESFGPSETLLNSLDLVVPEFFLEAPPIALVVESSFSYPAWLNRLE